MSNDFISNSLNNYEAPFVSKGMAIDISKVVANYKLSLDPSAFISVIDVIWAEDKWVVVLSIKDDPNIRNGTIFQVNIDSSNAGVQKILIK